MGASKVKNQFATLDYRSATLTICFAEVVTGEQADERAWRVLFDRCFCVLQLSLLTEYSRLAQRLPRRS